ncbi:L,D-transpeptidase family protein [Roseinatronobacter sp.]|uniref:L,D-transpeptidase family protein n=1 Tax=Roseinatronobacter sp. TaxID=1945755 RepID=UPI0025D4B2D2|nr:L,D-transpeptidase family protein [Roseibaca sp.]
MLNFRASLGVSRAVAVGATAFLLSGTAAVAQHFPAFQQAVAEGVSGNPGLSEFYRTAKYDDLWTGADDAARRTAFLTALTRAPEHGLPVQRYDVPGLMDAFDTVQSERDRGKLEARMSQTFVQFATDLHSGVLDPSRVDAAIVRVLPRPDVAQLMTGLATAPAAAFIRNLAPSAPEYARLFRSKRDLEVAIAQGGWGPSVPQVRFAPGSSGPAVIALRNRLIAMGYLERSALGSYDGVLQTAVQRFQVNHGIEPDGIAGPATIRALNVSPQDRLRSVIVAMERERWMNIPRGSRHVWVNLTDFYARIVDNDIVTFETKAIVGARSDGKPTPEFSETMKYLEINPDWTLPRSILARSYWGALASGGAQHLQIVDASGRVVPRSAVNFARYTPRNFPFNVRQPPGPSNALGEVKFMFPNPYAIYLHDTPDQHLFNTVDRTHSSGCVRLDDPRDFAYELLSRQSDSPRELYHSILNTGQQTRLYLDDPVPVHLVYRTAFTNVRGELNFRDDIYGRDDRIFRALVAEGAVNPAT